MGQFAGIYYFKIGYNHLNISNIMIIRLWKIDQRSTLSWTPGTLEIVGRKPISTLLIIAQCEPRFAKESAATRLLELHTKARLLHSVHIKEEDNEDTSKLSTLYTITASSCDDEDACCVRWRLGCLL